ncbi:hypothetical protein, conserved [Eimeria brunetti]|uniref:Uncharacterized protein n=1 Tax=Eimeria brunetti TaxID=51314 RepID=U6LZ32_9EIME|nr:hypothetical protein, conserved [Eimeria brunetti]
MDPFTLEPPIEEAQPAWWLELERSEARQNKAEKASSLTQKAVLTPAVPSNFVPGVEGRKVRFVSEPAADHHGFYENDTEFVISPAQPSTMTSPMQASEQSEAPLWDLSDLDDVAAIRRMLISTVDTPRSSSVGSFSASSSMDFHWSNHPSDAEPVFSGYYGSSVDRARPGV